MEFDNGYIKLYRSVLKWEWYDDPNTFRVFIYLLLAANWEDKRWHGLTIHRGEVITTLPKLAKSVGITVQSVRTALEHLKSTGEITVKSTNRGRVITVENYEKFQVLDSSPNRQDNRQINRQLTGNQQTTNRHTEEEEELKEDEEVKKRVLCAWDSLSSYGVKPVMALNPGTTRHRLFKARLKQYGEEQIIRAIENIKQSTFLQGGGNNGWVVTFDWFLKPNNFIKVLEGNYTDVHRPKGQLEQLLSDIENGVYDEQ